MIRRIVVGTDGSSRAGEAVDQAAALAQGIGAALVIVRAYPESPPRGPAGAYEPTLDADATTEGLPADVPRPTSGRSEVLASLEAAVAAATKAGVQDVTSVARAGDAADALISVAEEQDADVIVIGNKGMTGAARFLLGSVPNKITHHAPCDVLIAHTS